MYFCYFLCLFMQSAKYNSLPCAQLSFLTPVSLYVRTGLLSTVAGGWETSYSCCAAAVGAPGCQVSKVSLLHNSC